MVQVQITYATVDRMRRLTGIPLISSLYAGPGKIKRCGVFGPEADGVIYPDAFIQELARRNIKVERWETVI